LVLCERENRGSPDGMACYLELFDFEGRGFANHD
jgi:hypothetical protein